MNVLSTIPEYRAERGWRKLRLLWNDLTCCVERIRKGYCFRDVWSIDYWFLHTVPEMLDDLRRDPNLGVPESFAASHRIPEDMNDAAAREWRTKLHRMAALFREANEDTCRRKNPYEEEYRRAWDEFEKKHGGMIRDDEAEQGKHVVHVPSEIPEYQEICTKYFDYEQRLNKYRNRCLQEGLRMFTDYFWDLWS